MYGRASRAERFVRNLADKTKAKGTEKKDCENRVARWYIFKPKVQIWVNFGGSCNGRC
jgi:hypothetical protein